MQDYWLSYLHKHLVGQKVLNVTTINTNQQDTILYWESFWNWVNTRSANTTQEVRVYAHCSKPRYYVFIFHSQIHFNDNINMTLLQLNIVQRSGQKGRRSPMLGNKNIVDNCSGRCGLMDSTSARHARGPWFGPWLTSNIEHRPWCIHPGFKTHGWS